MTLVEQFLSIVAPHECLGCGVEGSLVCLYCAQEVYDDIPQRCYRCQAVSRDAIVCTKCRRHTALKYVWVATEYSGVAKRLIRALKFDRAKAASVPIADRMMSVLPYLDQNTIVTYVPTASTRERVRGYDQSQLIAKQISRRLGLSCRSLLVRHGQTRQVRSTRRQRIDQAAQMFTANQTDSIRGAHILLIDDIVTTGASLEAAARILRAAGATQIDACVFAQKQ